MTRLAALLALSLPLAAMASSDCTRVVELEWTAPVENSDGSPIAPPAALDFFTVYCGTNANGPLPEVKRTALEWADVTLGPGTWFCSVTATNKLGFESGTSREVVTEISCGAPAVTPSAPSRFVRANG